MRLLRELDDERSARMLLDALADSGIECELKTNQTGRHSVWVHRRESPEARQGARRELVFGRAARSAGAGGCPRAAPHAS
ncbi:MAG: hypothetical protein QM769_11180 [Pseudoxanthomonas sp.]